MSTLAPLLSSIASTATFNSYQYQRILQRCLTMQDNLQAQQEWRLPSITPIKKFPSKDWALKRSKTRKNLPRSVSKACRASFSGSKVSRKIANPMIMCGAVVQCTYRGMTRSNASRPSLCVCVCVWYCTGRYHIYAARWSAWGWQECQDAIYFSGQ